MKAKKAQKRNARRKNKSLKASEVRRSPRGKLKRAVRRLLPDRIFAGPALHGNTKWTLPVLSLAALFWACSGETNLDDRYIVAADVARHWFPGQFLATTYRGFIKALVTHNTVLLRVISTELRRRMLQLELGSRQVAGHIPFVVDGSKVGTPWTRANEERLGKKGRKPRGEKCQRQETDLRPQLTLTLLWHLSLGLPWAWKHGGLADGERTQFRQLLDELPQNALVVADAGFGGYALWQTIIGGGRQFLIRVGANVELLQSLVPDCELQHDGEIVWLWPNRERAKGRPPLKLRLITIQRGKETWYLVTSLLDRLTQAEACDLYTGRWGIECCFRTLKQTLKAAKVRSYDPDCAGAELDWWLLSMWLVELMAKEELLAAGIDPQRYSPGLGWRLMRHELRFQSVGQERLDMSEFQTALQDDYDRKSSKKARHDQHKKRSKKPGAPRIIQASSEQRQAAKAFEQPHMEAA